MKKVTLSLPIQAGIIEVSGITVTEETNAFQQLTECGHRYYDRFADQSISEIPGVQNARSLFRALGIEPTKHRPSSEAMLRRFLKKQDAYHVNNLVDVSNWCALDFLLPNGAYDRAKIVGDIDLRKGLPGEFYIGLNNLEVHLKERYTLADKLGPFGSPKTDSQRTCVDLNTKDIITIIYAPIDYDSGRLQEQTILYADRIVEYCGGTLENSYTVTDSL